MIINFLYNPLSKRVNKAKIFLGILAKRKHIFCIRLGDALNICRLLFLNFKAVVCKGDLILIFMNIAFFYRFISEYIDELN